MSSREQQRSLRAIGFHDPVLDRLHTQQVHTVGELIALSERDLRFDLRLSLHDVAYIKQKLGDQGLELSPPQRDTTRWSHDALELPIRFLGISTPGVDRLRSRKVRKIGTLLMSHEERLHCQPQSLAAIREELAPLGLSIGLRRKQLAADFAELFEADTKEFPSPQISDIEHVLPLGVRIEREQEWTEINERLMPPGNFFLFRHAELVPPFMELIRKAIDDHFRGRPYPSYDYSFESLGVKGDRHAVYVSNRLMNDVLAKRLDELFNETHIPQQWR